MTQVSPVQRKRAAKPRAVKRAPAARIHLREYSNIFLQVPTPACITSVPEGRFLDVNAAFCRETGFARDEIIGRTTQDLSILTYPGQREALMKTLAETGAIEGLKLELRRKSGVVVPYLCSLARTQLAGQICTLTVFQNLSEQVALERSASESTLKFRTLFEKSRDAIGVSKGGLHEYVNPAYLELFGYTDFDSLRGRPLLDLIAPGSRAQLAEIVRQRAGSGPAPDLYETRGLRRDGTEFDMEVKSSGYEQDGERLTMAFIRDITERKRAEAALREKMALLENAQNLARMGSYILDLTTRTIFMSAEMVRLYAAGDEPLTLTLEAFRDRFVHPDDRARTTRAAEAAYQTGELLQQESRIMRGDGRTIWIQARSNRMPNGMQVLGVVQDVTESKAAETALRDNLTLLESAQSLARMGSYSIDLSARTIFLSGEAARLYGAGDAALTLPLEEYRRRFIHPDSRESTTTAAEATYESGKALSIETQMVRGDGRTIWVQARSNRIPNGTQVLGMVQDITERKQAELALRDNLALLESAQDLARMGSYTLDLTTRTISLSAAMARLYGAGVRPLTLPLEVFRRRFLHPEERARITRAAEEAYQTGERLQQESRVVRADGRIIWIQSDSIVMPTGTQVLGMVQDITTRKQDETALRDNLRLLESTQKLARIGWFILDLTTRTITVSAELAQLYAAGDEPLRMPLDAYRQRFLHPDTRERSVTVAEAAYRAGKPLYAETKTLRADGQTIWMQSHTDFLPNGTQLLGVGQDITERKLAELALRDNLTLLKSAQDLARMGSYDIDLSARTIFLSAEAAQLFGVGESALTLPLEEYRQRFIHPDDRARTTQAAEAAFQSRASLSIESQMVRGDGQTIWMLGRSNVMPDGKHVLGMVQDITARKLAELALRDNLTLLESAQDVARMGSFTIDLTLRTISLSAQMARLYGAGDEPLTLPLEDFRERFVYPADRESTTHTAEAAYQTGARLHQEGRVVRGDGQMIWVQDRSIVMPNSTQVLGMIQDITERKAAEAALRDNLALLESAQALARMGSYVIDLSAQTIFMSAEMVRLYAAGESALTLPLDDYRQRFYHPDDRLTSTTKANAAYQGSKPLYVESRVVRGDGQIIWVQARSNAMPDGTHVLGVAQDVTERKLAELKALHYNRMYDFLSRCNKMLVRAQDRTELFENVCRIAVEDGALSMAWVGLADPDTGQVRPAAAFGDSGGYLTQAYITNRDEPAGRGPTGSAIRLEQHAVCRDIEHEAYMQPWRELALAQGFRASAAFPLRLGGAVIGALTVHAAEIGWFSDDEVALLDELAGDISYALDFMEHTQRRQQAEFELGERLKEITCLAGVRRDLELRLPLDELCQRIVDKLAPAMQFPEITVPVPVLELDGRTYSLPGPQPAFARGLRAAIQVQGEPRGWLSVNYLEERGFLLPYKQDLLDGLAQEFSLYLARQQAEQALGASQEQYRLIVETAVEGILVFDRDWRVTFANEQAARMVGYGREEVLGQSIDMFVFPDDMPAHRRRQAVRQTGVTGTREGRYRRKDGTPVWLHLSSSPLMQSGAFDGSFVMTTDITNRKQAELAMAQQAEELARLYRASGSLLNDTPLDVPSLAHSILSVVIGEFGQSNCSLFLIRPGSERLARVAAEGAYVDQVLNTELTLNGPGLTALAMRTGECVNVPDVRESADYVNGWPDARSELTIPLKLRERVIGCLDIQSARLNAFSKDDERLMTIFAERAALALEHARLYSQMAQWLENMTALHAVDAAITGSLDVEFSLGLLVDQVRQRLGVTWANVWLYLPATQTFKPIARLEPLVDGPQAGDMRLDNSLAGQVVLERRTISLPDLTDSDGPRSRAETLARRGFQAYLGIPLIAKGMMKGVLQIYQRGPLELDAEQLRFLDLLSDQAALAIDDAQLFDNLQRSNFELQLAYDRTIEGWSQAMDLRDKETEGHTVRVTELVLKLAQAAGLSAEELVQVRRGALLHDVGKLGVPDSILLKPDQLTAEEWAIMRQHPALAYQMLASIAYLRPALDIPYGHHEKWDGSGYPRGLKGEEIPLAARLFAVVDVWDALCSDRPYRKGWPLERVLAHIRSLSGSHFDPQAVSLFLSVIGEAGGPIPPAPFPFAALRDLRP